VSENALQDRLVSAVIFDDEARTGFIEACSRNAGLCAQPSERRFGERRFAGEFRHMQPYSAGKIVAYRDFHFRAPG
jgi:hypothetical protein